MQKPFQVSEEMLKEIEDGVEETLSGNVENTHDTPREMFGAPRSRKRNVNSLNSESIAPGSSNDSADVIQDPINHPTHYTSHPSNVECITVVEWMSFNLGNAVKYIWRAGFKGYQIEDLQKARWYVDREIKRLGGE